MKKYELMIHYTNGETDEYYSRMTGGDYWESDAETIEEALQEMRDYDECGLFEAMEADDCVDAYWVEEVAE